MRSFSLNTPRLRSLLSAGTVLFAASLCLGATKFNVESLAPNGNGAFRLDGLSFNLVHITPGFTSSVLQNRGKADRSYPQQDEKHWETHAFFGHQNASHLFTIRQTMERIDQHSFRLDQAVSWPEPEGLPTQELALQISLPLALAGGRAFEWDGTSGIFPAEFSGQTGILAPRTIQRLVLPSSSGVIAIEGKLDVLIQDQRKWRQNTFVARIRFPFSGARLTETRLGTLVRFIPWQSTPLSIRELVNRSFKDDHAGDSRGGWTDQGLENDISVLPAGPLKAAGVHFDIIDPDRNGGRSALVLGQAAGNDGLPHEATVRFSAPAATPADSSSWKNLYLLHAAAWLPAQGKKTGEIIIRHADGTEGIHPVVTGQDIGNWWSPIPLSNGIVGWKGENLRSEIGLYVSRFPLSGKKIESIRLKASGNSLWLIAGLSVSPDDIKPAQQNLPLEIRPSLAWSPYEHVIDIDPGSVFDFSRLLDAPAGRHGSLIASSKGHFEFENRPGQSVRFWGVNLVSAANFLEHAEADRLAERLARSGYNTARLHHFDDAISDSTSPHGLHPGRLDQLDYLFAALKQRGLYANIDLFSFRSFTPGEIKEMGLVANEDLRRQFKTLLPLSDEVFDVWARFARNFLSHRNPYTGLIWAEDPALIGICPVNEDGLPYRLEVDALPSVRRRYQQAFATWWQQADNREKCGGNEQSGFNRFIHECQVAGDARMRKFLRELGVKTLLTGTNFSNTQGLAYVREYHDYVDTHRYSDHPRFPRQHWRLPHLYTQRNITRSLASPLPRDIMPTRQWAKPFVVTEFNFVRPNRHRAEGGVLMPAYASLQDWDGLYNFEYASRQDTAQSGGYLSVFSLASDPIGLLADRLSAVLFLRRDIAPARQSIGYAVDPRQAFQKLNQDFPPEFSLLGFVSRIGSGTTPPQRELSRHRLDAVVTTPAQATGPGIYPDDAKLVQRLRENGMLPPGSVDEAQKRFRSDTGEIELSAAEGSVRVTTPRSELFVMPPKCKLEGRLISVSNGSAFGTLAVISADDLPLDESSRLLVLHLTDALPSGMRFAGEDRRLVEQWGTAPHLVHAGKADLRLRLGSTKTWRAWAVSASGRRLREVPLTRDGDNWLLAASTVTQEGVQLAYELSPQ